MIQEKRRNQSAIWMGLMQKKIRPKLDERL
jgi:hypothetical protein